MKDLILALDDEEAEAVLTAMTRPLARDGARETSLTPDLGRALAETFGVEPGELRPASEGDVARQALLVLAQDPTNHQALAAFLRGDMPASFSVGLDAAVVAGVLVLLQTEFKFEKHKDSKTSWKITKKATSSEKLLKPLVEKLLGWLSLGSK